MGESMTAYTWFSQKKMSRFLWFCRKLVCARTKQSTYKTREHKISKLKSLVLITRASMRVVSTLSYCLSYLCCTSSQIAPTSSIRLLYALTSFASSAAFCLSTSTRTAFYMAACLYASIAPNLRQYEPPPRRPGSPLPSLPHPLLQTASLPRSSPPPTFQIDPSWPYSST